MTTSACTRCHRPLDIVLPNNQRRDKDGHFLGCYSYGCSATACGVFWSLWHDQLDCPVCGGPPIRGDSP